MYVNYTTYYIQKFCECTPHFNGCEFSTFKLETTDNTVNEKCNRYRKKGHDIETNITV